MDIQYRLPAAGFCAALTFLFGSFIAKTNAYFITWMLGIFALLLSFLGILVLFDVWRAT